MSIAQVVVKPPSAAEERVGAFPGKADAVSSTKWWADLKEDKVVAVNSDRAIPLQCGLETLQWDRENAEVVESGRFSSSFFHPCAPQIRPAVSSSVLRFPIVMSSKRKGSVVEAFENDAYGEIPDALRANAKLTSVSSLPDGRPLQGKITAAWTPSTKYRPPSAIGNALLGFTKWDDPNVVSELRRLSVGSVSGAQDLIRNDLDASAAEIRKSWASFCQAEKRVYGPFSGFLVLQTQLEARRAESAGDLPVVDNDLEYQRDDGFLSREGSRGI